MAWAAKWRLGDLLVFDADFLLGLIDDLQRVEFCGRRSDQKVAFPRRFNRRLRRRLWGLLLFCGGAFLFSFQQPNWLVGSLGGPSLAFFGLSGVFYPLAIPDPRPEFGVIGGWSDVTRKQARVGFCAMSVGVVCGLASLLT